MPIEGPLRELGVHDVFQLLDLTRKTGVLRITSDMRQNAGRVLFDHGAVVGAEMRSSPQRLGQHLLRSGKITDAELVAVRARQAAGDTRPLGELLVDSGVIARRELERVMRRHVEEVLFELMSWSEGYFTFEESVLDAADADTAVRIPTEAILMEAARRIDEWSRMETVLPHTGVIPRLADAPAEGGTLDLTPLEWEVLASVDGVRSVRDLAATLERSEFDIARILFGLVTTGILTIDRPAPVLPAGADGDAATALGRAAQYLAMGDMDTAQVAASAVLERFPAEPEAYVLLGRVRQASGAHADAAEAFRRALDLDQGRSAARRMLGVACVAMGRFDSAVEQWDRWRATDPLPAEEERQRPRVEQWRSAAITLMDAIRGRHD